MPYINVLVSSLLHPCSMLVLFRNELRECQDSRDSCASVCGLAFTYDQVPTGLIRPLLFTVKNFLIILLDHSVKCKPINNFYPLCTLFMYAQCRTEQLAFLNLEEKQFLYFFRKIRPTFVIQVFKKQTSQQCFVVCEEQLFSRDSVTRFSDCAFFIKQFRRILIDMPTVNFPFLGIRRVTHIHNRLPGEFTTC